MTAQVKDSFVYCRKRYYVSAVEHPDDFLDIHALGFRPTMFSTACYRGFFATFAIHKTNLVLKHLYTNNGSNLKNEAPLLNGKLPEISINEDWFDKKTRKNRREFTYKKINLKLPYTGSILITKDYIREGYFNMGFHAPIYYKTVLQLTFDKGKFIEAKDFSAIAKSIREGKIKIPEKEHENIFSWIDDCFDISYKSKAKGLFSECCANWYLEAKEEELTGEELAAYKLAKQRFKEIEKKALKGLKKGE